MDVRKLVTFVVELRCWHGDDGSRGLRHAVVVAAPGHYTRKSEDRAHPHDEPDVHGRARYR